MRVVTRIGQGGFGNVDHVILEDGTNCARKEFAQNQPLTPELLDNVKKRFSKEATVQSAISHPNIVPIIMKNLHTDPPYYLMPLADSTLDKDLGLERTLDGKFVSAISDIVAALEEIHSMGIYHRDLKPQNVLRFHTGEGTIYAVSDFGLISMKESNLSELTKTGMGKGSDYYTAPEIHADLRKASARSDVYSLGCILHDMVGKEQRIPFREIIEDGEFGAILSGCTKDDPNKRFQSAKAILDAILTVEFEPIGIISAASEDYVAKLTAAEDIETESWDAIADHLERRATKTDIAAICGSLTADRIGELNASNAYAAKRIGMVFCEWVSGTAFNFELCDAIANRVEHFFYVTDLELKVECLMALLKMGTSHNRWYVERKFVRLCSPEMDIDLAKRFIIEFHIRGKETICPQIEHLEFSIGHQRDRFHPRIVSLLSEFCG